MTTTQSAPHSGEQAMTVEVTQEDREAYLAMNMLPEFDAADVRAGLWDKVTGLQILARHRIEATRAAAERIAELEGEVSYLLDRSSEAGRCRFGGKRWTGMSSNAINAVAFGRDDPEDMPFDSSDLAACYEMLKRMPKHLLTDIVGDRLVQAETYVRGLYSDAVDAARTYSEWPGYAALQRKEPGA